MLTICIVSKSMDMEAMFTGGETFDFSSHLHRGLITLARKHRSKFMIQVHRTFQLKCTHSMSTGSFTSSTRNTHTHTRGLSKPDGAKDLRLKVWGTLVNDPSCINTKVYRAHVNVQQVSTCRKRCVLTRYSGVKTYFKNQLV